MRPPLPHIAAMAPYALADMAIPSGKQLISLAQNESLRPPAPGVRTAVAKALSDAALYPDPDWTALRTALSDLHGLDAAGILCGCGSLDLIAIIARAFAGPGRSILAPAHAYPFFRSAAQMSGARFDTADERDLTVSVDALLAAVGPETAIVFVANPGNPTGTHLPDAALRRLRARLRQDVLLVIDEAYGEFADPVSRPVFDLVEAGNTMVLRTFSKAYGLAGFRVGWGLFPTDIARELRKVMNPNSVSVASQAAARAALADHAYMRGTCALTADLRDECAAQLQTAGLHLVPSSTNFVLIDFGTAGAATEADAFLRTEGVLLRRQSGAGLPHCLRMTIGPSDANQIAVARLTAWKKGKGA